MDQMGFFSTIVLFDSSYSKMRFKDSDLRFLAEEGSNKLFIAFITTVFRVSIEL